jgi:hypothetical protein
MTLPNFYLWHPVCARADGEVVCRFDVTAPELSALEEGDAGVMAAFAEALRLGDAPVRSWRVERFCTPYYAHDPAAEDWRDRLDLVWRVEMRLAGDVPAFEYSGLGPVAANGRDSTSEFGDYWDGGVARCVVIADEPADGDLGFLQGSAAGASVEILEYPVPGRTLHQARVDLGMLDLPGDEPAIRSVVELCAQHGASTHWMATSQRPGWPESRLPRRTG